ncbi:tetratricopeptide repeat protein [Ruminococcus sp. XPD3002]|uniref:tetratricopeptide repeat protein n=1 Tax=Ruminococcus sp. XPD3002 TaxID=1452269 RepID=UPI0015872F13
MNYCDLGVENDYANAVEWYKKAAEQGDDWGQANLGRMFQYGYGVVRDKSLAIAWYKLAAKQGNGLAILQLEQWNVTI